MNPFYRKSNFIAEAAFEMIIDLSKILSRPVEVDYEYVLKRVCSAGPDNIYEAVQEDENVEKYGDGVHSLNPKRYQSNQRM